MDKEISRNKQKYAEMLKVNENLVKRAEGQTTTTANQEIKKHNKKHHDIDLATNFRNFDTIKRKRELEYQVSKLEEKVNELITSNGLTYNELQARSTELAFAENMLMDAKRQVRDLTSENRRLKEYLNDCSRTSKRDRKWMKNPFKKS